MLQLSDFGLAMWGPTDSPYVINTDVVGTFGYIAPEYLMHGKLSDKIDIYAFGIVLLELLSGRRPIDFGVAEGQRSLVLWVKTWFFLQRIFCALTTFKFITIKNATYRPRKC